MGVLKLKYCDVFGTTVVPSISGTLFAEIQPWVSVGLFVSTVCWASTIEIWP